MRVINYSNIAEQLIDRSDDIAYSFSNGRRFHRRELIYGEVTTTPSTPSTTTGNDGFTYDFVIDL